MAGSPTGGGTAMTPQQQAQARYQQMKSADPSIFSRANTAYNGALNTTSAATNYAANMPAVTASTQQAQAQGYSPFTGVGRDGFTAGNATAGTAQGYGSEGYAAQGVGAQGFTSQGQAAQGYGAQGYTSQGYGAQGYGAQSGVAQGFSAMPYLGAGAYGTGYTAERMGDVRDVIAGQFTDVNIDDYMNPYRDEVIDRTRADMERARLIEQNAADDAMQSAGAFGGSRHGVANAETNRNYYDRLGSTVANLRDQGYQNAQAAAFQDIGNSMQADFANQQSDLTRGAFNATATNDARRFGADARNTASLANAQRRLQAGIATAGNLTSASSDTARFFTDASRATAQNLTDASRATAQNRTNAGIASAGNLTDASRATAQNLTSASQATAQNMTNAGIASAGNLTDASRATAQNMTNANISTADNRTRAGINTANNMTGASQANAGYATNASIANAQNQTSMSRDRLGYVNDARRFGADAQNLAAIQNAQMANQQNRFNAGSINDINQNRFSNVLSGASQMSGLAGQGVNIGNSITDQQMRQGELTRQINQQIIDAGRQQYANYTNAGNLGLSPLSQFVNGNYGSTTTQTENPGLFGAIGQGASLAGSLGWAPFSDRRLKTSIRKVGEHNGVNLYDWDWTDEAKPIVGGQPTGGVMADEVAETHPQFVITGADGYQRVDYVGLARELA